MPTHPDDAALREALETCAREPVHIPGMIQPFAFVLGCEPATGAVCHASQNLAQLLDLPVNALFASDARTLLGSEVWHGVRNVLAQGSRAQDRQHAATWHHAEQAFSVEVSHGGDHLVLELEPQDPLILAGADGLRQQGFLLGQIADIADQQSLLDLTCDLMRHVSGYDRVMMYRFDSEWNGAVVSESKRRSLEPMLGLHFPSWDIPEQARAILRRVPLRMISDVDQVPVPLLAADAALPPLDLSLVQSRGVSPVHLQYLRNMGSRATLTLSILLGDTLWGVMSFHHRRPRVLAPEMRQALLGFLPVFCMKLEMLRDRRHQGLTRRIDRLQSGIRPDSAGSLDDAFNAIGAEICDALAASGICLQSGSQTLRFGEVPEDPAIAALQRIASDGKGSGEFLATRNLGALLPGQAHALNGQAGALVSVDDEGRALMIFRAELATGIAWAGNPDKTVEQVDGQSRLEPRSSFSAFLETAQGRSLEWTEDDIILAGRIWPVLNAIDRQRYMDAQNRQQGRMIDELNHRVRNMLALVKSVSRQARSGDQSAASYAEALEARILALVSAHEAGAGSARDSVSIRTMFEAEARPHQDPDDTRIRVRGQDVALASDLVPVFGLTIHELVRNAVQHGALSVAGGQVAITLRPGADGLEIDWTERGGPPVVEPDRTGFGTRLIRQAIPYEMGGRSEIDFDPDGLRVRLWLPSAVLEQTGGAEPIARLPEPEERSQGSTATNTAPEGPVLVVEDNFVLASDLCAQLEAEGFRDVQSAGNVRDALEIVEAERPAFALLDINLGRNTTSEPLATELLARSIPFLFVTAYGEQRPMPPHLADVMVLAKPVSIEDLRRAIAKLKI